MYVTVGNRAELVASSSSKFAVRAYGFGNIAIHWVIMKPEKSTDWLRRRLFSFQGILR